ncbi:DUF4129 domain-containing protein [Brevibacillus choshinensis]|uniref:DUF4129 domain-containing protein n=1 Tax=Brevibacillus choshinensis TaxID=54911 RepID=UPI002E1E9D2E|nr:DUF4129 domain-containing protein [Brevibacillus choshinensis]MED4754314.1 DUF4129 domain-containing protein [Brevibacillus choshinensis]MED4782515.1 DUF4129 domain-containing protein [Brevibacillus choshinensis]
MIVTTIGRWTLAFWLEALLLAGCFMLFGYLSAGFGPFLLFGIIASLLFVIGGLIFHEGSRNPLLLMLLYLIVAGVGVLGYLTFDSGMIALIVAALYFWRIQAVASDGISHANLQRRFVLVLMVCLIQLVIGGLYGSAVHSEDFQATTYYWMLGLTLGSYLLLSLLEYVTREHTIPTRLPASIRVKLGGQVLAAHSLVTIGYLLIASAVLGALALLWSWVKGPLGSGLYWLIEPILKKLADWAEGLSGVLGKDGRVNDVLDNQGQGADQFYLPVDQGEPLINLLEPYLIVAASLLILIVLTRYIWKRRYHKEGVAEQTPPTHDATAWTPLSESDGKDGSPLRDVRHWFKKTPGPADDPVRYAYYQFLKHTASRGMPIYRFETSQEYLLRLHRQWQDPASLQLAAKITDSYEKHRYREQSLAPEELAAMKQAVKSLRETAAT